MNRVASDGVRAIVRVVCVDREIEVEMGRGVLGSSRILSSSSFPDLDFTSERSVHTVTFHV